MEKNIDTSLWPVFDVEKIEIQEPGRCFVDLCINHKDHRIDVMKYDFEFVMGNFNIPSKIKIKSFCPRLFESIFYYTSENSRKIKFFNHKGCGIVIESNGNILVEGSATYEELNYVMVEMQRLGWLGKEKKEGER